MHPYSLCNRKIATDFSKTQIEPAVARKRLPPHSSLLRFRARSTRCRTALRSWGKTSDRLPLRHATDPPPGSSTSIDTSTSLPSCCPSLPAPHASTPLASAAVMPVPTTRSETTHCVPRLFFDVCPATPKEPAVATFRVVLWHMKAELVTVTPLRMHGREAFVCSLAPRSLWLQSAARLGPLLESLILKLARGLARSSLEPTSRGQN